MSNEEFLIKATIDASVKTPRIDLVLKQLSQMMGAIKWELISTAPQPSGQDDLANAFKKLKAEIKADSSYAWSWHSNIAMPIHDAGIDRLSANRAAARVMRHVFDVDATTSVEWKCSGLDAAPSPAAVETLISADDLRAFNRFCDTCEDSGSGGYDVPKEDMQRLARIGLVRWCGGSRYETTEFGDVIRNRQSKPAAVEADGMRFRHLEKYNLLGGWTREAIDRDIAIHNALGIDGKPAAVEPDTCLPKITKLDDQSLLIADGKKQWLIKDDQLYVGGRVKPIPRDAIEHDKPAVESGTKEHAHEWRDTQSYSGNYKFQVCDRCGDKRPLCAVESGGDGFGYVDVVGLGYDGWINLFFGEYPVGLIPPNVAAEIKKHVSKYTPAPIAAQQPEGDE
jgi:hypothetical protein